MRNDVTRTTLAVLFIGVLIIASLWILRAVPRAGNLGDDGRRRDVAADAQGRAGALGAALRSPWP